MHIIANAHHFHVTVLVLVWYDIGMHTISMQWYWYWYGMVLVCNGMVFVLVLVFDPKLILTCGPIFPNLLVGNGFDWCAKNYCHCCVTGSREDHGKRKWMT
jgi:hypothetical protein